MRFTRKMAVKIIICMYNKEIQHCKDIRIKDDDYME